jgi:hypothetical protein
MFPIAIVAGVIGAVVSTAQGASWIQDHLGSSGDASSVGGKSDAKSPSSAGTSPSFEAALAAQVTGQSVPTSTTTGTTGTAVAATVASVHQATAYDTLERTKAGIATYGHVGEHRNGHAKSSNGATDEHLATKAS